MSAAPLSTARIARENIRRKPLRSLSLILVILLFSFSLFAGSTLSTSLSRGMVSLSDRLGADVMIVPEGYDPHIDSILLSGKPSTFYLPHDVMDRLKDFDFISKMTPQTFLATLNASCCSYPVQLVGIDYQTDFLIKPWLRDTLHRDLKPGEIILGNHVSGKTGDTITFFRKPYKVACRLGQTGMGFDATVFMTKETIVELAHAAERIIDHPLSKDGSLISTVMIRLKPGYDSISVTRKLNEKLNESGIYALFSKKFVNDISSNLTLVSRLVQSIIVIVWILAIIVIALLFAITLNERKRELGILRSLGATRGKLTRLMLTEALLLSLYGTLPGTILAGAAIFLFAPMAVELLNIPFLLPSTITLASLAGISLAVSVLTSLLSAAWSALRGGDADIYDNMRGA